MASAGGMSVGMGASAGSDGTSSRSSSDMDQSSIVSQKYCVFTSHYAAIADKFHASGNKKTATPGGVTVSAWSTRISCSVRPR